MSSYDPKHPKTGDIVQCMDDMDIGVVVSTRSIPDSGGKLMVEVEWRDSGRCTDGWCSLSFNTYDSLYEIVSRA